MTITAMPTAKHRKTRTRTKRVSNRPAIHVSKMLPNLIDLLPGTESLVCPDCETWCPITGRDGLTPKLVPHHTNRVGTPEARRCSGSNRLVLLDLTIPQWHHLLADAIKETSPRRATNVLRKPKAAVAPAITQITPRAANLAIRAAFARERARFDQLYSAQTAKGRAAEWAKQAETKVTRRQLAKRAGTATEELNNVCRIHLVGALTEFRSPGVPLNPLRITA
uniref:hypothetical protein n=1 Tax=Streptomyces flavovirens TaxID=52258 RepID=UPI00068BE077|nr:hypothetical protein [Streptomyces flavovirens]